MGTETEGLILSRLPRTEIVEGAVKPNLNRPLCNVSPVLGASPTYFILQRGNRSYHSLQI